MDVKKTAVILFNLGGPDSRAAIRPFLFNFFMDPNIIRLPFFLRWPVALLVSWRRSRREAADSYGLLGGASPLLANTKAQADALQSALGPGYRVYVCMRYWHPLAVDVAKDVRSYAPDKIVLLPLYPQYSTTTTRSAFQAWSRAAAKAGLNVSAAPIEAYPAEKGFVHALAALVKEAYDRAREETGKPPRILFSAHGLPESIVRTGDPYQRQCEETARAVIAALGVQKPDWAICYQSRVGPGRWIGPALGEELGRAAGDGVPVVVCPHSFTQEHVETLAELDIEYRHKAQALGVPGYYRVPAVGIHPAFIRGLADLVMKAEGDE